MTRLLKRPSGLLLRRPAGLLTTDQNCCCGGGVSCFGNTFFFPSSVTVNFGTLADDGTCPLARCALLSGTHTLTKLSEGAEGPFGPPPHFASAHYAKVDPDQDPDDPFPNYIWNAYIFVPCEEEYGDQTNVAAVIVDFCVGAPFESQSPQEWRSNVAWRNNWGGMVEDLSYTGPAGPSPAPCATHPATVHVTS